MKRLLFHLLPILLLLSCSSENNPAKIYVLQTMQKSMHDQYAYGHMYLLDLREMAEDKSQPREYLTRVKQIYRHALHIDSLVGSAVYKIEQLKWKVFKEIGVKVNKRTLNYLTNNELAPKNASYPNSYDWTKIRHTGESNLFDEATIKELKNSLRHLRKNVCEYLAFSVNTEVYSKFSFVDPQINDYKDADDFTRIYTAKTKHQHIPPDDVEILKRIYFALTKNEQFWQNVLTEKDDWTEVMQMLLALETDILDARSNAITSIRFRIGCGADFGFTHILPVVDAPTAAIAGDTLTYTVYMAAFNADKNPSFTIKSGGELLYVKNGIGYFRAIVPQNGNLELNGLLTIFNKSGIPKTVLWKRSVKAIRQPKNGS